MKVEESIVYPAIAKQVDDGDDMVEEAKTEHEGARKVLADVEKLSPNEPGFDGALEMLEAGISHHVEEEEDEVFPKFRESVSAEELDDPRREGRRRQGEGRRRRLISTCMGWERRGYGDFRRCFPQCRRLATGRSGFGVNKANCTTLSF